MIVLTIILIVTLRNALSRENPRLIPLSASLGCVGGVLAWVWPLVALLYGSVGLFILAAFNLKLMRERRQTWYYLGANPFRAIKEEEMKTIATGFAMLVPTTISFVVRVIFIANDI